MSSPSPLPAPHGGMKPWDFWRIRPNSTDERIIQHTYYENGYEIPDDLTGKTVLDVGANVGAFSVLCAERGATVVALEPHPDNFAHLVVHCRDCLTSGTLMQLGLGAFDGYANLWINESNTGGHSITEQVGANAIEVNILSLGTILNQMPVCDILKLDCEGAEKYAFDFLMQQGNAPERAREQISSIVCEIHDPNLTQEQKAMILEPYYEGHNIFQADWRFTRRGA